jgi:hypothetical protein
MDGLVHCDIKEGAYNGDAFTAFLEDLVREMNPYPGPRSVLVMDNSSIHHVDGIAEACLRRYGFAMCYRGF